MALFIEAAIFGRAQRIKCVSTRIGGVPNQKISVCVLDSHWRASADTCSQVSDYWIPVWYEVYAGGGVSVRAPGSGLVCFSFSDRSGNARQARQNRTAQISRIHHAALTKLLLSVVERSADKAAAISAAGILWLFFFSRNGWQRIIHIVALLSSLRGASNFVLGSELHRIDDSQQFLVEVAAGCSLDR